MEKKESRSRPKLTEAHLKKHYPLTNWVHFFTDGSHDEGVFCTFFEEAKPLSAGKETKFVILCDSISAAQFVTRADNLHPQALLFKNFLTALRQHNKTLELQWIPNHCDILGNKKADYLAKLAAKKTPPPGGTISFNKAKNKIKSAMKKVFKSTAEEAAKLKTWWEEVKRGPDKPGSEKRPLPSSDWPPATTACNTTCTASTSLMTLTHASCVTKNPKTEPSNRRPACGPEQDRKRSNVLDSKKE